MTEKVSKPRKVVVTGLGAITPLGGTAASTWEAVLAGRSGVCLMPFDLPVKIGAPAAVDPSTMLSAPDLNHNDRSAQFALIAAREAWHDAGLPHPRHPARSGAGAEMQSFQNVIEVLRSTPPLGLPQDDLAGVKAPPKPSFCGEERSEEDRRISETRPDPNRLAVCISSSLGGIQTTLDAADTLREKGARRLSPLTIPMLMPNSAAAAVELEFGAQAGAFAPTSACASGAEAIAYGYELIKSGRADIVLAGGTEAPLHPMVVAAFAAARALSTRNDSPATASRPFDLNRDGFVMGEGAAVLVLESEEHAAARGALIYAVLAGTGITSDAYHVTAPEPTGRGQIAAMTMALRQAGLSSGFDRLNRRIVHVNPHATSTKLGDAVEAHAIRQVFGDHADYLTVSATKSMTAHLLGAAGALEAMLTVLALHHRTAPPTINLFNVDPAIEIPITTKATPLPDGNIAALSNSFGFGGHNVSLVFTS